MDKDSQKIILSLKEVWHKMDVLYSAYAKSLGLNFTTLLVLELLHYSDQAYTQKEICEKLGLPKQLVNSIIKLFWQQGHVELKEAKDRRNKEIILLPKGKEYALKVLKPLEDAESSAWESFSAEDVKAFARTTNLFAESFEQALREKPVANGN